MFVSSHTFLLESRIVSVSFRLSLALLLASGGCSEFNDVEWVGRALSWLRARGSEGDRVRVLQGDREWDLVRVGLGIRVLTGVVGRD